MPSNLAAFWSAVAASCAAFSSFLIMWIRRRMLLESVRPQLFLTEWSRRPEGNGENAHDVIAFKTIRNVGRGVALDIMTFADNKIDNLPTALFSGKRLSFLAANEKNDLPGEITVWWKNVESDSPRHKHLFFTVRIIYYDSRDWLHETRYKLFIVEFPEHMGMQDPIAPGVMISRRKTIIKPAWSLKFSKGLKRIPILRRLRRKKS